MTQTPAADIVERVIMHAGICGRHHDDNCQSCRFARDCTDAEIDRLHAEIEALRARVDERLTVEERLVALGHKYCDEIEALRRKLDEATDCLHDATCIIGHLVPMDAYALAGKKLVAKDVWNRARSFLASIRGEAG